jgi:hypothetical protein
MPVLLSSIVPFGKVFHYTELGMVSCLSSILVVKETWLNSLLCGIR